MSLSLPGGFARRLRAERSGETSRRALDGDYREASPAKRGTARLNTVRHEFAAGADASLHEATRRHGRTAGGAV